MIKNEAEVRIALQAVLVTELAVMGYWGCAFVVILIMIPWKPLYLVGCYLAQPIVDWRIEKARDHKGKEVAQVEQELSALLDDPEAQVSPNPARTVRPPKPRTLESLREFEPTGFSRVEPPNVSMGFISAADTRGISPAIQNHVRSLPQGAFSNMELEVEDVKFHGDTADAAVRFKSSNVAGLVIRQRYLLRRSGEHWEVESRQPANGAPVPPPYYSPRQPEMRAI